MLVTIAFGPDYESNAHELGSAVKSRWPDADVSYVGLDVTFLKTLHWRPFTKNFQELFIRFYGMVESAYTRGIKIENNSYSTEPKEYFDYTQKDLVKKTIILIKHWSKKEKVKN